jgi:hypothetical protein
MLEPCYHDYALCSSAGNNTTYLLLDAGTGAGMLRTGSGTVLKKKLLFVLSRTIPMFFL